MERLSIDDFIRVEEHLSKKLKEACGEFKMFVVTEVCESFDGQPLSRDQFGRIYGSAYQRVLLRFKRDCELLGQFFPPFQQLIVRIFDIAHAKINDLYCLEWQILVGQLP